MDDLSLIIETVSAFGSTMLFLWLLLREMNSHELTRAEYRRDLRELAGLHSERLLQAQKEAEGC
jgi:hypothetical protein